MPSSFPMPLYRLVGPVQAFERRQVASTERSDDITNTVQRASVTQECIADPDCQFLTVNRCSGIDVEARAQRRWRKKPNAPHLGPDGLERLLFITVARMS